jgi:ribonuclease-3
MEKSEGADKDEPQDPTQRTSSKRRVASGSGVALQVLVDALSDVLQPSISDEVLSLAGEDILKSCAALQNALSKRCLASGSISPPSKSKSSLNAKQPLSNSEPPPPLNRPIPVPPSSKSLPPLNNGPRPSLPEIKDEAFRAAVFTHASNNASPISSNFSSYERLEFIGDAYIELISTLLLSTHFPTKSAGRLAQLREQLVKNETLAGFSRAYGLSKKIAFPSDFIGFSKNVQTKVMADVFEAYVAGIVLSDPRNGVAVAEEWLTALWSPQLQRFLSEDQKNPGNSNAKQELAVKVMAKGIKLDYRDAGAPMAVKDNKGVLNYPIDLYITGWGHRDLKLGHGVGFSKVEAGMRAAQAALKNPMVDELARTKKKHFELQQREKALASGAGI